MANWAYGLAQGGAAAADTAGKILGRQMQEESDIRAADRKLSDAERLKAIEESFTIRAEERKRANALQQGKTINEGATGLLNSGVATKINSTYGSEIDPNNPDSKATLEAIRNNPEAAKAYGLEPETDLTKGRARAEAARNIGDLAAAKEEEGSVRNLQADKRADKTAESTERRLDIMEKFQQKQADRQQTLAEATLAHQRRVEQSAGDRASTAETAARRAATATALKGVNDDIKALEKEAADQMLDQGKRTVVQKQLDSARNEAAGYRRALAGAGLDKVDAPPAEPATPPPQAIEYLKKNPTTAALFEAKYPGTKAATFLQKAEAVVPAQAAVPEKPGLLASEPPYTPPADSPAGLLASRTAETRVAQEQKRQQIATEAQTLAQQAIASRDPVAAQAAQDAPGFASLPQAIKTQIFALVRGRI